MASVKDRLARFNQKFKSLLGARAQGYDELSTLERPLVSDVHEQEDYERQHGVAAPGGAYRPPAGGAGYRPPSGGVPGFQGYPPAVGHPPAGGAAVAGGGAVAAPSQADELQELSLLARDAAEILWEMAALGEAGAVVDDMKSKAQQLQAQLRGLISDYQGGDESIFAKAFESFDMLSRCLEELAAPPSQELPPAAAAVAGATPPAALAPTPVPAAVASQPPTDEAPLISFD